MFTSPNNPLPRVLVSVSPGWLHPGPLRIVGRGGAAAACGFGNQCTRIRVPSNDVTSYSEGPSGIATAWGVLGRVSRHEGRVYCVGDAVAGRAGDGAARWGDELERAPVTATSANTAMPVVNDEPPSVFTITNLAHVADGQSSTLAAAVRFAVQVNARYASAPTEDGGSVLVTPHVELAIIRLLSVSATGAPRAPHGGTPLIGADVVILTTRGRCRSRTCDLRLVSDKSTVRA